MTQVHLSIKSRNEKVGPIPVSTTTRATCPSACALAAAGCYAKHGHVGMHWIKVSDGTRGGEWSAFCDQIAALKPGQAWRHNQAGDLPGDDNVIDVVALAQLVAANIGKQGWTYTHKPVLTNAANAAAVAHANANGFVVNLSANHIGEVDALAALKIGPVVTVLDTEEGVRGPDVFTPGGLRVVTCPATYRDDVSCGGGKVRNHKGIARMTTPCLLCARGKRSVVVGFPAHGAGSKAAAAIARGE